MKKLLSVVLTLCVLLSLSCITSFGATDSDITPTGAREYQLSENSDMTAVDGYVYGVMGEVDYDDTVSIMDATAIQLHIAQIETLMATQCLLADVDFDNQVSVIDATEIQLHIAQLVQSNTISRVLYTPFDNFDPMLETFDDISNYLLENGRELFFTMNPVYDVHDSFETEGVEYDVHINYSPSSDTINISSEYVDGEFLIQSSLSIKRGDPEFTYMIDIFAEDFAFHDSGKGIISNISEDGNATFDLAYSDSALSEYPEDVLYATIAPTCLLNLLLAESHLQDFIVGTVLDLVYDISTLV